MVGRAPRYHSGFIGSCGGMPDECLMSYYNLFTRPTSLLYNFIVANGGLYMNIPLSNGQHETYCLNAVAKTGAEAARLAGYCPENPQNARVMSWYLLKRQDVRDRIAWLRAQATDDAILTLVQMKQVLSEIARANLKDYQDSNGKFRPLDDDAPNPSAVAEVIYKFDPIKRQPYIASLRLRDPVGAIVELCRLDGNYKKKPMAVQVAPVVSVEDARTKLAARIERIGSGAIESGDIGSQVGDGCSEGEPS